LSSLHSAGKKVWLLSNAQRIFTQYELQMLDIDHCFDGILISSDYGFSKPDPRFFQQLTSRFSVDFRSSLFIGNDAVNDIGGARNVGLDSFYVHSNLSFITPEWLPQEDVTKSRFPGAVSAPVCFQLGDTRNYTFMNFTGWEIG
ncbi:MAG: HAD family hydrolase, partial [Lachnospiraceae bacterium]|nr:HAD family hydrolase [Lachnospiraceae bacterium]